MSNKKYFKNLNYSIGDEDSSIEGELVQENTETILCIAGSGARAIPLLSKSPKKLICTDISRPQLELAKLRFSAIEKLNYNEYLKLLGYQNTTIKDRLSLIERVAGIRNDDGYIDSLVQFTKNGNLLIYSGGFEKMLKTLNKVISVLMGKSVEKFSNLNSLESQIEYYNNIFPKWKWKVVLALLANGQVFNTLLYKGDFPKKTINKSYYQIYSSIFNYLFTSIEIKKSFFLQLLLLGGIKSENALPAECNLNIFNNAKKAIKKTEIIFEEKDIYQVASDHGSIDFVSLSDVPSFETDRPELYLQKLRDVVAKGGIVVSRTHVREVEPILDGYSDLSKMYAELFRKEVTGLWSIYVYKKLG